MGRTHLSRSTTPTESTHENNNNKANSTAMEFINFPNEIFFEISSFQSLADQNRLFRTNRHLAGFLHHVQLRTVLSTRDSAQGRRALYAFASRGDTVSVRYLLDRGILSFVGSPGSVITAAIRTQTETTLRTLLDCDISAKFADDEGQLPLVIALENLNVGMLRVLISKERYGVDINAFVIEHDTPLMWATAHKHKEVVRALLEHPGINVNEPGPDGFSALHVAVDYKIVDILKMFLEDPRVDISTTNGFGITPLIGAILGRRPDIVQMILQHPRLDIHAPTRDKKTPLHRAAFLKDATILKMLLQDGRLDVNAEGPAGRRPLHMAVTNSEESVRTLLEDSRIDVNAQNLNGSTPLHSAVGSGTEAIISALLEDTRVDAYIRDSRGETPLDRAMVWRGGPIVKFLRDELNKRPLFSSVHRF